MRLQTKKVVQKSDILAHTEAFKLVSSLILTAVLQKILPTMHVVNEE